MGDEHTLHVEAIRWDTIPTCFVTYSKYIQKGWQVRGLQSMWLCFLVSCRQTRVWACSHYAYEIAGFKFILCGCCLHQLFPMGTQNQLDLSAYQGRVFISGQVPLAQNVNHEWPVYYQRERHWSPQYKGNEWLPGNAVNYEKWSQIGTHANHRICFIPQHC